MPVAYTPKTGRQVIKKTSQNNELSKTTISIISGFGKSYFFIRAWRP
jgi:hypothetical protein